MSFVITQNQLLAQKAQLNYYLYVILYQWEFNMSRIHFDQDIQPLSEFRAGVASYIKQINETRRPLVITQRGKGVAVVLDVAEYEAMQEKIELLEEMRTAETQLASGLGVSNDDARAQVLGRIKK